MFGPRDSAYAANLMYVDIQTDIYIYHAKFRLNTPLCGSLCSPNKRGVFLVHVILDHRRRVKANFLVGVVWRCCWISRRFLLISTDFNGFLRIYMDFNGFFRIFSDFKDFCDVLQISNIFTDFKRISRETVRDFFCCGPLGLGATLDMPSNPKY